MRRQVFASAKRPAERVLAGISRDWTIVSFEGLAAPSAPVRFDRLASWTESSAEDRPLPAGLVGPVRILKTKGKGE